MNLETFNKPLVIAHRGDTKAGLENTLPAIAGAIALGVDGIEVDLRLTRDGHIVLFHDDDLRRLAGRPEMVETLKLTELREISLNGGFQIPTLEELLDLTKSGPWLNLELKSAGPFSRDLERKTIKVLAQFPRKPSRLLLSSFHPASLWHLHQLEPNLPTGYLFAEYWPLHRMIIPWLGPDSVNAPISHLSHELVDAQRKAGRRVFVWTVNSEDDMNRCIKLGVDGIITDEPQRLLEIL